ncbi:hypothetical protein [Piscirickettsia salmonis]|uniref:hypothetical protein n=1 Tax=Piscirickettsia salmonis TaxID=1238 RepID=UPI0018ACF26E|nr:hypothetical protein [Piscirickettsia salmonis]
MLGDFASLDVQNTYRGSDAYVIGFKCRYGWSTLWQCRLFVSPGFYWFIDRVTLRLTSWSVAG